MERNLPTTWYSQLIRKISYRAGEMGVYLAVLLVLLIIAIIQPSFFQMGNLFTVLRTASILSIVSIGQLLVILVGGIDLSVGSMMTTAVIISADITRGADEKLWLAVILCILIAFVNAGLNIFLILKRNVPPFVATLGTYVLMDGARLLYTKGVPQGAPSPFLQTLGRDVIFEIPITLIIAICVSILFMIVLKKMRFGRQIYAAGSNPEAARLSGIPVQRIIASAYILCSLLAMFTGLILGGYIGYADRYLGRGFDLDSISAVVIGGASFAGGIGGVGGTIAGILLMVILSNFMTMLNLNVQLQLVMKGLVILLAVGLYVNTRRNKS